MAWVRSAGPVRAAFVGSLLLSWVALSGALINRDGIHYVEVARAMLEQGFALQRGGADWQFLSILMAGLSALTGMTPETSGHLLNALLLAGTCSLLVAIVRRRLPEAAWAACLVVLAMPAYNGYRNELLREYGFWFFCALSFWLAMRWEAAPRWREALACQLALGIAALFRLEAVAFYPALMLWQAFAAPAGQRVRRVIMLGCLPMIGAVLAAVLFGSGTVPQPARVSYYFEAANPVRTLQLLNEAGSRMSETVFKYKYSREEAGYILFFGLLSVIPMKFLKMAGVFVVPLAYAVLTHSIRAVLARWQPLPWAFLAYLLVLIAFVTHQFFLVGRYVSLLNLLAVPVAAAGFALLMQHFPRWRGVMVALALVTMAANVVSLSPKKTHIAEAGRWLGVNAPDSGRVGVDNARIAYYAGWRTSQAVSLDRAALGTALAQKRIDMVAVEAPRKDAETEVWLAEHRLQAVQRFANKAGDAVIVAVPVPAQVSPSIAERNRSNTASTE
ncbi:MAG: glycosyltransferase family 39 protein [Zoogloeaceae bacterium]|nr:glycosyltransferase family 39 protein [Zoogloeaceae bacterium]